MNPMCIEKMKAEECILAENKKYWTWRAASYSEENVHELSAEQHGLWNTVLTEQISNAFPAKPLNEIDVLDVGTGPGFFAILLAEMGCHVTAIDLTPSMLQEARRNAADLAKNIRFFQMNAQALAFENECFDVVVSRNLTWNLPSPEQAYAEWTRVLRSGGLLLNFDANWYRYLFDRQARAAYMSDRKNSEAAHVSDYNVGDNYDEMEKIARYVPMSRTNRPEWDENVLTRCGLTVNTDERIWQRVWSVQEKLNFASTPMFMVSGRKSE